MLYYNECFFQSSNGVYVGLVKIPQNIPYILRDSDIVGIGWIAGAPLADINNEEKFVFKLCKEYNAPSISNRIKFQGENEIDYIEEHVAALHCEDILEKKQSPVFNHKLSLKRKADNMEIKVVIKDEKKSRIHTIDDDIVTLLSDSDNEYPKKQPDCVVKCIKLEPICEEPLRETIKDKLKCEDDYSEYDAFDVKQEYLGYDDEPIKVDSDSDSESEHWYLRLSQSSPGKPFIRKSQERAETKQEDSSYSQMDDDYISFVDNEEEEFIHDLITIPPENTSQANKTKSDEEDDDDIIFVSTTTLPTVEPITENNIDRDEVDAFTSDHVTKEVEKMTELPTVVPQHAIKKTLMIEPHIRVHKSRTKNEVEDSKFLRYYFP